MEDLGGTGRLVWGRQTYLRAGSHKPGTTLEDGDRLLRMMSQRSNITVLLALICMASNSSIRAQMEYDRFILLGDGSPTGLQVMSTGESLLSISTSTYGGLMKVSNDGYPIWDRVDTAWEFSEPVEGALGDYYSIIQSVTSWVGGLAKFDTSGNVEWARAMDTSWTVYASCPTDDGGCSVLTHAWMPNAYWLVRFDADGDTLWARSFLQTSHGMYPSGMKRTLDGGFVVWGTAFVAIGGSTQQDFSLIRFDGSGSVVWAKRWFHGVDGSDVDELISDVEITSDSSILIAGACSLPLFHRDLMKIDGNGSLLWSKRFPIGQGPHILRETPAGELLAFQSNSLQSRFDASGNPLWSRDTYGMPKAWSFMDALGEDMVLAGGTFGTSQDTVLLSRCVGVGDDHCSGVPFVIQMDPDALNSTDETVAHPSELVSIIPVSLNMDNVAATAVDACTVDVVPEIAGHDLVVSPSPFYEEFTISGLEVELVRASLINALGSEVPIEWVRAADHGYHFHLIGILPAGTYFVQLTTRNQVHAVRVIKG